MGIMTTLVLFFSLIIASKASIQGNNEEGYQVTKSEFPDGFLFGVATSAYQIEGGIHEDGKSLSNWDVFVRTNGVENGDTGDITADHYHRYLEDVEILHSLGVDAYRFSLSWSRILPRGRFGGVNPGGIKFYGSLIDNLLLRGIKPFVTIHQMDHPQELTDIYGSWLSPLMQEEFLYFAEVCFKYFGDRVKHWMTLSQPEMIAKSSFMRGIYPPGRCSPPFGNCSAGNSDIEPLIVMHNMLLAHAKTVKLYREQFQPQQKGIIGITVGAYFFEPLTNSAHDIDATNRFLEYVVGWTCDPVVFGEYPPEMRRYIGKNMPKFTPEESELIKGSFDFLGLNHYTTLYVRDCLYSRCSCCVQGGDRPVVAYCKYTDKRNGVPIGEPTALVASSVVPRGIERAVDYVMKRYNNRPMYVTENGYSFPPEEVSLNDVKRINYHKGYLDYLARSIRNGADVRGYFIWTLMDSFEWSRGFTPKFGLYSVDPVTRDRIPRTSAKWYRDFLKNNTLSNYKETRTSFSFAERDGKVLNPEQARAEI